MGEGAFLQYERGSLINGAWVIGNLGKKYDDRGTDPIQ
jgi:hypothetical protein